MYRRVSLFCLATLVMGMIVWSSHESSLGTQVADRYHARNRTSNFYAKSAGKPQVKSSGSSSQAKPVQRQSAKFKATK